MDKRTARSVLRNLTKARALIEAGWVKETLHEEKEGENGTVQHSYCMIGAIRKADGAGERDALRLIGDTAQDMYPNRYDGTVYGDDRIWVFNDHPKTRKPQVLRVLNRGIKQVEDILNGNS